MSLNYALLIGMGGNDTIHGGSFDDILVGDDFTVGSAGNDIVDGGGGVDTAVFSGSSAAYSILATGSGLTVSGPDGNDALSSIERLRFADKNRAFDTDGAAGSTVKLIGALFGWMGLQNEVDVGVGLELVDGGTPLANDITTQMRLVGIGLQLFDGGMSYAEVADVAIHAVLGLDPSNTDLVRLLYTNVVGNPPDDAATKIYVDMIESGYFTQVSITTFAADHELNTANIDLVGLAETGIEYV